MNIFTNDIFSDLHDVKCAAGSTILCPTLIRKITEHN